MIICITHALANSCYFVRLQKMFLDLLAEVESKKSDFYTVFLGIKSLTYTHTC
jgi:hypothetical protein